MTQPMYFEDWVVGDVYLTPLRPVTQREVDHFAEVEGAKSALHLDPEYAKQSVFGELTVHGLLTLSMATGMMGKMGLFEGSALAFLGLTWKFHLPVRVGDTLRVRWWVTDKRLTAKPGRGVIVRQIDVLNQEEKVVCSGDMTSLWACRPQVGEAG